MAPHFTVSDEDPRLKRVLREMERCGRRPDALIQVLHIVQESFGHLPGELLRRVGRELRVPASRVYGVATFYNFFSLKPQGEHQCVVCTGTACYVKGAGRLVEHLEKTAGVRAGQTTADGKFSLLTARCIGACGLAPVAVLDGKVMAKPSPDALADAVRPFLA
jgi:bidirectional [NiFe] hydrogenase diaphorase subunit